MNAPDAKVVDFTSPRRAPTAQPVTKLRALEVVRALICEGELQHVDMTVAQYLCEITDKKAGTACVEVATIAERIGRSRPTAVRSLLRLIDAGVIEREVRRRGKRCFASIYCLVDPNGPKGANDDIPRFRNALPSCVLAWTKS